MDDHAVAAAIAARFAASLLTAPTGEDAIKLAAADLPSGLEGITPCVLVFPPECTYSWGPSFRTTDQEYPIRFYLGPVASIGRAAARLAKWRSVLVERLIGHVQLGLTADGVTSANLTGSRSGALEYADVTYAGIELACLVHLVEGITYTA